MGRFLKKVHVCAPPAGSIIGVGSRWECNCGAILVKTGVTLQGWSVWTDEKEVQARERRAEAIERELEVGRVSDA